MAKLPYIPIYPGDWERDANCLKAASEYALFKLTIKLNDAKNKGVYVADFDTLSVLFKCDLAGAERAIKDLKVTETLEIEYMSDGFVKIESRRILREKAISEARSEAGKKSATKTKSTKGQQKLNKHSTKPQQNTEIEIENIIEINSEDKRVNDALLEIFDRWVSYKSARKEKYKTADSLKTAFEKLKRFSGCDVEVARKIIDDAIGNNWAGFFEPKQAIKPPDSKSQLRGASDVVAAFSQVKMNQ